MECNKDEAMKAKQIAESKMQCGDFVGALKFATKAKNMYADVENISKILTVCEVHCAAQNKLSGSSMDWYGILQAERFSDCATLKKQYRRLALLLHPDKNKFYGAEAAFKLIGEANRVLGDQTNRSLYDMTCGVSVRTAAPKTSPHHSNGNNVFGGVSVRTPVPKTSSHHSNGNVFGVEHNGNATNYQKKSSNPASAWNTFWTSCQHCNTKYQYYKIYVNASISCLKCMQFFTALDLGNQGVPPKHTQKSFSNQNKAPKHAPRKPPSKANGVKPHGGGYADKFAQSHPVSMEKYAAAVGGHCKDEKSEAGHVARGGANGNVCKPKAMGSQTSANVGSKRVRQSAPYSRDSFNSSIGDDMKDADVQQNGFDPSRLSARRSSRQKKNVSYAEDDFESTSKKPRQNESFNNNQVEEITEPPSGGLSNIKNPGSCATSVGGQNREMGNQVRSAPEEASLSNKSKIEQFHVQGVEPSKSEDHDIQCPDADFSDFEKDKAESCFTVNQFWAIYDDTDTMPRFYALVKKVASPFKLQFTWLEPDPDDESGISWFDADLPIGCGKFKLGGTQKTADRAMFSHQMHCIKGSSKGSYLVCPKQGETWAIFRDWDMKWSSDPEKYLNYEFDYVEILSDYSENNGIEVAYLGKVKGFVSLFQKTEKGGSNGFCVHPNELYRFSHRVPSFKMTGNEREGVPRGSFELDPAALPSNLFDVGDVKM